MDWEVKSYKVRYWNKKTPTLVHSQRFGSEEDVKVFVFNNKYYWSDYQIIKEMVAEGDI